METDTNRLHLGLLDRDDRSLLIDRLERRDMSSDDPSTSHDTSKSKSSEWTSSVIKALRAKVWPRLDEEEAGASRRSHHDLESRKRTHDNDDIPSPSPSPWKRPRRSLVVEDETLPPPLPPPRPRPKPLTRLQVKRSDSPIDIDLDIDSFPESSESPIPSILPSPSSVPVEQEMAQIFPPDTVTDIETNAPKLLPTTKDGLSYRRRLPLYANLKLQTTERNWEPCYQLDESIWTQQDAFNSRLLARMGVRTSGILKSRPPLEPTSNTLKTSFDPIPTQSIPTSAGTSLFTALTIPQFSVPLNPSEIKKKRNRSTKK